jgi:hypothetical protein
MAAVLGLAVVRLSSGGPTAEQRTWCAENAGAVMAQMDPAVMPPFLSLWHIAAIEDYLSGKPPRESISDVERQEIDRACTRAYARLN